jgi:hypothetical protein
MNADLIPLIIGSTPVERLKSLRDAVDGRIVFTTSFGIEAQALTHMIAGAGLDIELATLDTGRPFPSTYKLWADTGGTASRSSPSIPIPVGWRNSSPGVNGFYDSRPRERPLRHPQVEPMSGRWPAHRLDRRSAPTSRTRAPARARDLGCRAGLIR